MRAWLTHSRCTVIHRNVLFWCQHHGHGSSFELGVLLNIGIFFGLLCDVGKQFPAPVRKRNLATSEHDGYLDLILIFNESIDMIQFYLNIMFARFGPNLDLLDLEGTLLFFGLLLLFGLFVFITTVVHDFTDRRICIRRYLHQIETEIAGNGESLVGRNNTYLSSIRIDDSDFFCSNVLVDIGSVCSDVSVWSFWKSYTPTSLFGIWI